MTDRVFLALAIALAAVAVGLMVAGILLATEPVPCDWPPITTAVAV